jgi:hypothetical protein
MEKIEKKSIFKFGLKLENNWNMSRKFEMKKLKFFIF